MTIASMIIGILAGLGLLGWGLFGYALGALGTMAGVSDEGLVKLISVVVPIAVLVGAGIVMKKPLIGGILMLGGAIIILGFIGLNVVGEYIAVPALIAGLLGRAGARMDQPCRATGG